MTPASLALIIEVSCADFFCLSISLEIYKLRRQPSNFTSKSQSLPAPSEQEIWGLCPGIPFPLERQQGCWAPGLLTSPTASGYCSCWSPCLSFPMHQGWVNVLIPLSHGPQGSESTGHLISECFQKLLQKRTELEIPFDSGEQCMQLPLISAGPVGASYVGGLGPLFF